MIRCNLTITIQAAIPVNYKCTAAIIRLSHIKSNNNRVLIVSTTTLKNICSSSNITRFKMTCHKIPTTTTSTDTPVTRVSRLRIHVTPRMVTLWTITTSAASISPPATTTIRVFGIQDLMTVISSLSTVLIPYLNPVVAALSSKTSANEWLARTNRIATWVMFSNLSKLITACTPFWPSITCLIFCPSSKASTASPSFNRWVIVR